MIDNVPLIQNANDVQQINASIIAMKKASRELDEKIAQFNKLLSQEITNREKAITEAINSLDVSSVGGSGKYISAISESDGKISATAGEITSIVSSGNSQPVTSGGVYDVLKHYPDVTYYNFAQSENIDCNNIKDRVCLVTALMNNWQNLHYPFQGLVFIITANNTDGNGFQKAISWGYDGTFPEYTRVCKNGVWQSWKRIPYIDYTSISGTTDNNGLLDLGSLGNCIPLIVYNNNPYITQFFNGATASYHPYVRITNYDGTPIANTQVTLRLIVLPL